MFENSKVASTCLTWYVQLVPQHHWECRRQDATHALTLTGTRDEHSGVLSGNSSSKNCLCPGNHACTQKPCMMAESTPHHSTGCGQSPGLHAAQPTPDSTPPVAGGSTKLKKAGGICSKCRRCLTPRKRHALQCRTGSSTLSAKSSNQCWRNENNHPSTAVVTPAFWAKS